MSDTKKQKEKMHQGRQCHVEWCKKVLRLMDDRLENGINVESTLERRALLVDMLNSAMDRLDADCKES